MKKFACLVLALAMVFSLSICASAATTTFDSRESGTPGKAPSVAEPWTDTQKVIINVTTKEVAKVYYVEVTWETMTFTYDFSGREWNPEKHTYENNEGGWKTATTANIKVANHSNAAVTVTTTFADANKSTGIVMVPGVSARLDNSIFGLPSAEGYAEGNAPTNVTVLTIDGAPVNYADDQAEMGVVVTITAD